MSEKNCFHTSLAASLCLLTVISVGNAQYSGGSGTADDPYQIATAADLIALGETPDDYDKHFELIADIDLSGYVYDRAVIAPHIADPNGLFLVGTPFTGVFDGHGHTISRLTIEGEDYIGLFGKLDSGARISNLGLDAVDVNGDGSYVGGLVGSVGEWYGADIIVANCYSTGSVSGAYRVGGLVGTNGGSITSCYSTGSVSGESNVGALVGGNSGLIASSYSTGLVSAESIVGGLAGINWGSITSCYSSASTTGDSYVGGLAGINGGSITSCYSTGLANGNETVGGLVGTNGGSITSCYSTGAITGNNDVGGLVGDSDGSITASFWDTETSGQPASAGGTGLTTAEMQDIGTYLREGWDFVDEVRNGTCDHWQMSTGDYPRLQYCVDTDPVMPEGLGTAEQPYLIRDANDLGTVWFKPTAHYRLEMSLDLSGTTWPMAVVPWFDGIFEGNGHVIRNLHIQGGGVLGLFGQLGFAPRISNLGLEAVDVNGTGGHVGGLMSGFIDPWRGGDIIVANCYSTGSVSGVDSVGGLVGDICFGNITSCYSTCSVTGDSGVGGLVGWNLNSTIATSYCTGSVSGNDGVGGLVGCNDIGTITSCYSRGSACGRGPVGGLVGRNEGTIGSSYSTGSVTGDRSVGGLVGYNDKGTIISSFWDIESSGATESPGGTGLTTPEMQTAGTFLDAGWDFIDETENGTDDIWWIREGRDYPRLWWKHSMSFWVFSPDPPHGAADVTHIPTLSWRAGEQVVQYDVYFGDDAEAVASAATETPGIYRDRQSAEKTTYAPGVLELNKTYYWRIDDVIEGEWDNPRKGHLWSFTTADYLVVTVLDDFEGYNDALEGDPQVSQMWIDGSANGTIGWVSLEHEDGAVYDGRQAMRFTYWNVAEPWHAQTERLWQTPQNWTLNEADTLTLYVRGARKNDPEPLYVAIEDASGRIGLVTHPDADAVRATEWQKWHVALADLQGQGVDVTLVKRMVIGVGDENDRQYKRLGTICVDDIRLTRWTQ